MFETSERELTVSKQSYRRLVAPLRTGLLAAQRRLSETERSVIVLVNGVEGAGKGAVVNLLNEWLDARFVETCGFSEPTEEQRQRPRYWRFWMALPERGRVGVILGNWYTEPIVNRVVGTRSTGSFERDLSRIEAFERALVEDGAKLVKLWLHISKKKQAKVFPRRAKKRHVAEPMRRRDRKLVKHYDAFIPVCERAIQRTSTGIAPWIVVDAANERYRNLAVGRALLAALEGAVDARPCCRDVEAPFDSPPPEAVSLDQPRLACSSHAAAAVRPGAGIRGLARASSDAPADSLGGGDILDDIDLTGSLDKASYERRLRERQHQLRALSLSAEAQGVSTIAVFEGWDASGKGGAIRRITPALDARQFRVIPVAAPTDEEKGHHYLWRFWRHLPRRGRFTIYDRSWYGRVLVERVEGFAQRQEWQRAYAEINEFEAQLVDHGVVLCKFWLHISQDEQLRRLQDRERTAWKQHKVGPEDYRNRAKASDYRRAVHEMIARTSVSWAPWTLVAAESKRLARLQALETLIGRLQEALTRMKQQGRG